MATLPIEFPSWVTSPKRLTRRQLASNRLRFLVMNAALQAGGAGNVATFAHALGMHRTTITSQIKAGKFSHPAAVLAEKTFGQALVRKEWLTDPLNIDA